MNHIWLPCWLFLFLNRLQDHVIFMPCAGKLNTLTEPLDHVKTWIRRHKVSKVNIFGFPPSHQFPTKEKGLKNNNDCILERMTNHIIYYSYMNLKSPLVSIKFLRVSKMEVLKGKEGEKVFLENVSGPFIEIKSQQNKKHTHLITWMLQGT